jgi:hypothetical protein
MALDTITIHGVIDHCQINQKLCNAVKIVFQKITFGRSLVVDRSNAGGGVEGRSAGGPTRAPPSPGARFQNSQFSIPLLTK